MIIIFILSMTITILCVAACIVAGDRDQSEGL